MCSSDLLPSGLPAEQVEKLQVIAAKCPVHRTLDGEAIFEERVEFVEPTTSATDGRATRGRSAHPVRKRLGLAAKA